MLIEKGRVVFQGLLIVVLVVSMMPSLSFADEVSQIDKTTEVTADNSDTTDDVADETGAVDESVEDSRQAQENDDVSGLLQAPEADIVKPETQVDVDQADEQSNADSAEIQSEVDAEDARGKAVEDEEKEVSEESLSVQASGDVLPADTYYISSALGKRSVLDVSDASKSNGANVQLWTTNVTAAQQWKVSIDDKGYATLTCVNSGKALDVSGARAANGVNVQQYAPNNTKAQKWVVTKDSLGYKFTSAINSKFVLDCAGASKSNGTNIQLYSDNGTKAQRFTVTSCSIPEVKGSKTIDNGAYTIKSGVGNKVIDISDAGTGDGANAQIWEPNGTKAQVFQVSYEASSGCYLITNLNSGKRLDDDLGNPINGTNVHQWFGNSGDAQRWKIEANDSGYILINKGSGKALDVSGGSNRNGANLQTYSSNKTSAQTFTFSKADLAFSGVYSINTALSGSKYVDVPGASTGNNVQLQIYQANASIAQKYVVKREADNTISIRSLISGLRLADQGGKVVQQKATNSDSQKWVLSYNGGYILTNKATGKVMDVVGAGTGNGTKIQTYKANNSKAQRFRFTSTDPVNNGCYSISPACAGGKYLDFVGSSWNDGVNLQIWSGNGSNAQKFDIIGIGGGYYRITSNLTWSSVDVRDGSNANGANVQLWTMNSGNAQKWRIVVTEDGWYSFQNANGKFLDVSGGSNANGSNIAVYQGNGSNAQKFRLADTSTAYISGNGELDNDLRNTIFSVGKNGDILNKCYWRVVSNSYGRHGGNSGWGILSDGDTRSRALSMYRNGSGICYDFAAQFMWLSRALGFSANVRSGGVPSLSGGVADHGWTEIYYGGGTIVCDPDLQYEIPGPNFYWRTYANAPVEYYL